MNTHRLFLSLTWFLLLSATGISAQNTVMEIKQDMEGLMQKVSQCGEDAEEPCGMYSDFIETNAHNEPWPAVGIYSAQTSYWYERAEESSEPNSLRLVIGTIKRSDLTEQEIFYYGPDGQLRHYHLEVIDGDIATEQYDLYFSAQKLLDYTEEIAPEVNYVHRYSKDDWKLVLKAGADRYMGFQLLH